MFTLASGSAPDVFYLSDALDVLLVDVVGWTRHYTISSGVATRDRVYFNGGGSETNEYDPIYCRVRATAGVLYNYAYTYYSAAGDSWSGELGGNSVASNPGCFSGSCVYWLLANLDGFWCVTNNTTSGTYYSSGVGYVNSYFCPSTDPYPVCVVGQELDTHTFFNNRAQMYDYSGSPSTYTAESMAPLLVYGLRQARSGAYFSTAIPLMNATPGEQEMRGELRGIRQVYGLSDVGSLASMSGTLGEYYLFIRHAEPTNAFVYGPVTV